MCAAIATLPGEPFRVALVAADVLSSLFYGEAARSLRAREATITTRLYGGRQRVARTLDTHETPSGGRDTRGRILDHGR